MNLLKKQKKEAVPRKKKAITIVGSTLAVIVVAGTAGALFAGSGIIGGNYADRLSGKESPVHTVVEKATEKSTSQKDATADERLPKKEYKISFVKKKAAVSTGDKYTAELADGIDLSKYKLNWSSSDESVATVDKNGIVTGVADGKATITCQKAGSSIKATLPITVTTPVYPEALELNKAEYTLTDVGELLKLSASITPEDTVTETKLKWSSSDESVAVVSDKGVVKAVSEGTATIYCTTANDITAECLVTVQKIVKADELFLDYVGYDFSGPQSEPVKLTATVYPENATYQDVAWHSTNENVACVDNDGNVTITGDGKCDIVCTTIDGTYLSKKCEITAENTMPVVTCPEGTSVYVPVNPVAANSVIEEALRYVGKIPYVWGGTDLSTGVDCSGFICAVYQRFGINLWGVRTDLYLAGTEVKSIEEAKAGDILCYPGHVAIYDGNGGRVHAYDTGYMIMHDTNIGGYYTIRRIIE